MFFKPLFQFGKYTKKNENNDLDERFKLNFETNQRIKLTSLHRPSLEIYVPRKALKALDLIPGSSC